MKKGKVITLEDLEKFIAWNTKAQQVGADTPQHEIEQIPFVETFVSWMRWQEGKALKRASTKVI